MFTKHLQTEDKMKIKGTTSTLHLVKNGPVYINFYKSKSAKKEFMSVFKNQYNFLLI